MYEVEVTKSPAALLPGTFLSWQVEGWKYDASYKVEIAGVSMQSGQSRRFSYQVFIERDNLEE